MKIEAQIISFFISVCFALLGVFNYFMADSPYMPIWGASFICLLITVGFDVIERIQIERRVNELTDDEKLPYMCRRQTD